MADWLAHLADQAERPSISVQVLPSETGDGSCIEVADQAARVLVRDTTDRTGPVLWFTPAAPSAAQARGGMASTSLTAPGRRRMLVTRRSASLAGCPVRSRSTHTDRSPIRAAGRMSKTQLFAT
jgi:hypothetical protein